MRAKAAIALLSFLVLSSTAAAETTTLGAGPASVTVVTNDTPSCVFPAPGVPCPAGYDTAGTPQPHDDAAHLYRSVDRVEARLHGPVPVTFNVSRDLQGMQVRHDLIDRTEAIVVPTEAAIPEPLGKLTYTIVHPNNVEFVFRLKDKTPLQEDVSIPIFLPLTDRNGTYVPNGFAQGVDDSDTWGPHVLDAARLCWIPQLGFDASPTCDGLPAAALAEAWAGLTPRLLTGISVNQTAAIVGDATSTTGVAGLEGREGASSAAEGTRQQPRLPARDGWSHREDEGLPGPVHAYSAASLADPGEPVHEQGLMAAPPRAIDVALVLLAAATLLLPFLWLYLRMNRAKSLHHQHRANMLDLAREKPGILVGEAAKALALSYQSARHHARMLQRCGHLDMVKTGHYVALYPLGSVPLRHRAALVNLRHGRQADVLRAVHLGGGLRVTEVAKCLDMTKSSAHARLAALEGQGLVARTGLRRSLTPLGLEALHLLGAREPPAASGAAPP